ncbi:flap endonuclease-1 [archaeon]|jgi:flap endonuclease-1|nr:flap endonuclease-1 [archaeon]MBT7128734.1 flap endonuclease-1 [archaeon]
MGVNISKIIPRKEINLSDLKGKTIAIDAYVTLYQFLTTIRQPDGTPLQDQQGNTTSHLSGLFYRNINLLQEGIKPVYVFDGKPPALKQKEIEKRIEAKETAERQYQEAKIKDDIHGMKKYASRTVRITDEMLTQSKELLEALGIPVIQAPSEGEAEAAALARQGKVYAAASQDYDTLLYATPFLIRNLTSARRKKLPSGLYIDIKPELIEFQQVLNELGIDKDQLTCLAILVGTDYNPGGVKGLGQQRALQVVQQYKYPVEIFRHVSEKFDFIFDWQEIFKQFQDYKTEQLEEIEFQKPNKEKIKQILTRHDFSEARINSALDKLQQLEEAKKQKGLNDFF